MSPSRTRRGLLTAGGVAVGLFLAGCAGGDGTSTQTTRTTAPPTTDPPVTPEETPGGDDWRRKVDADVLASMSESERVPVVVVVRDASAVDTVESSLTDHGATDLRPLRSVPAVAARAPADAIRAVARLDVVREVRADRTLTAN
jgi:hypothetical protein